MGKKMIVIAEIVFALVFILIMSIIFSNVLGFGNTANANLENIRNLISEADLTPYDGTIVSGDTVISTINKMKETKTGLKLSYIVSEGKIETNGQNALSFGYNALSIKAGDNGLVDGTGEAVSGLEMVNGGNSYSKYDISARPEDTNVEYISPVDEYDSKLIFNINGVLVGMLFEET